MHVLNKKSAAAVAVAGAALLSLVATQSAHADTAPRSGDVVGVGSDTLQNGADFLFDGAPGVGGAYNTLGNFNRVFNEFATGDANGRAVYDGTCGTKSAATGLGTFCDTTTNQTPNLLAGSIILRSGTAPVVRPNGSGAGVAALTADSGPTTANPNATTGYEGLPFGSVQYARMSRLPNSTEESNCDAISACGGLHVYQAATDTLVIARQSSAYNGPAGLSVDDLYKIFVTCSITKWNQLPGNSAGSSDTIDPLIPQSGSGTRNFFLADIQAAEGLSSTPSPGTCTRTVEEHDPTGIYADPSPADAIEPFSLGKLAVLNGGTTMGQAAPANYFANGAGYATASGKNAFTPNTLSYLTGTPGDGTNYASSRGLYFTIRNADLASTTPFQPGGTQNFAKTLFAGTTSVIARSANAPQLEAAGFIQAYKDCGVDPTTC